MTNMNFKVNEITKDKFAKLVYKIEDFLKNNFIQLKEQTKYDHSRAYMVEDRDTLTKLISGIKTLGYEKFNMEHNEYSLKKWTKMICKETKMMEEEKMVTYVYKGLTSSKKLACISYITIGESNGKYVVSINETQCWQGYSGKPFNEFKLSSSLTSTISASRAWSETIFGVSIQRKEIRNGRIA